MSNSQSRRGPFVPGFDSATGQAHGRTFAEWAQLSKGMNIQHHHDCLRVYCSMDVLQFEIFTQESLT